MLKSYPIYSSDTLNSNFGLVSKSTHGNKSMYSNDAGFAMPFKYFQSDSMILITYLVTSRNHLCIAFMPTYAIYLLRVAVIITKMAPRYRTFYYI